MKISEKNCNKCDGNLDYLDMENELCYECVGTYYSEDTSNIRIKLLWEKMNRYHI